MPRHVERYLKNMASNTLPPSNIDAEMSILGAIFVDTDALGRALEQITVDDFYREAHRKIFVAMCELSDSNEPIDFVTMSNALKNSGCLEEIGGTSYLLILTDYVPTSANVVYYAKIVAEKAKERRLITHAQAVISMIQDGLGVSVALEKFETGISAYISKDRSGPVSAAQVITESVKRLKMRYKNKGKLQGMTWGIDGLNDATSGIHRGELVIVAGRPSMGKSAFAGNILRAVCTDGNTAILFSLEMSRQDCMDRFIADRGNIKLHHLRNGRLEDVEWSHNQRACAEINAWKLFIDDTAGLSLREVKTKVKQQKKNGLDLVVIDYLQLMSVPAKENRVQSLGEISRGLKVLAREMDIAVILLSQLNRAVDGRADKRPLMSDLRDSGEIEQDADVILFPFREAAYCQECRDRNESHDIREHQAKSEIIIEKQRNGERNISIPTTWLGMFQRFEGTQ